MHNIWEFLLQTASATLVAGLLLLIKRLFEDKLSPRWQYGIWILLALRILLPVQSSRNILLPLPLALETVKSIAEKALGSSVYTKVYTPLNPQHPIPVITQLPVSLTDWLFLLYAAGVLLFLLRYQFAYLRLRHLLKQGEPVSSSVQQRIYDLCETYQLKSCRTVMVEGLTSAFVCGVFHPVLALPSKREPSKQPACTDKNTDQFRPVTEMQVDEKIILHELLHVKHWDALQNILWCIFRAWHWCNPFLLPVFRRIENDMESLCDQRVLEHLDGEERREYGRILLAMANDTYARAPGTTSISNGGKNISRRIAAIVRFKKYPKGMALVSLCILLLLGIPCIVGTAATYDASYFQPTTQAQLDRAMAMTRIYRCGTMAGALDTYAKGLLLHNGIYLATASPLSEHATLEAQMRQNLTSKHDTAWYFSSIDELGYVNANAGYQLYNLTQVTENHYEVLLILPLYDTFDEGDYYLSSDGRVADENSHLCNTCYLMVPLRLWKEDAWVVEETGERTLSRKNYSDTVYDANSSDIPWLQTCTLTGESGTLTSSVKLSYHVDNVVAATNELSFLLGSTTSFNQVPLPNAKFAEIRLHTITKYACHTDSNSLPKNHLAMQTVRLDREDALNNIDWPMEHITTLGENYSGSSNTGYSWDGCTVTAQDMESYSLVDIATDTLYDTRQLPPELPYGHLIQIFWDSEFKEDFFIRWK